RRKTRKAPGAARSAAPARARARQNPAATSASRSRTPTDRRGRAPRLRPLPVLTPHLSSARLTEWFWRHNGASLKRRTRLRREIMPGESPLSMMRPRTARRRAPDAVAVSPRRRLWPLLLLGVVVAAAGWCALWYYAAQIADRTMSGWMAREAAA